MDDANIVALYWARDERAIAESTAKYGAYCLAIARNILGDRQDAEESVNDTWAGAWRSIPPQRPVRLGAFLGAITRKLALRRLRDRCAEKRGGGEAALALEELQECLGTESDAERKLEQKELAAVIDAFLDGLNAQERRVFVCRYWYLDSVADIASRFGFSQSKVKSMLFRTRGKLRERLQKEGYFL